MTPILSNPILKLTVFAHVNSAFDALDKELRLTLLDDSFSRHLGEVLLHHVTNGENLSTGLSNGQELTKINENKGEVGVSVTCDANGNVVVLSDSRGARATVIDFDNIDAVLLPSFLFRRASDLGENYSTLISLAVLAGVDTRLRTRTITLFAPTNEEFAALPVATLDTLTSPEGLDTLVDMLSYHVVLAFITSDKLEGTTEVTAKQGNTISITVLDDGTVTVNDTRVVEPAILVRNGVTYGSCWLSFQFSNCNSDERTSYHMFTIDFSHNCITVGFSHSVFTVTLGPCFRYVSLFRLSWPLT